MKRVLVLGAGLVTRPGVRYLAEVAGLCVTVADQDVQRAEVMTEKLRNVTAVALDVTSTSELDSLVAKHDVTISLLPWTLHGLVAEACLRKRRHLITTSYVSDEMRGHDAAAREMGLLFLNEIGLDPGIDHLTAVRTIEEIKSMGGVVESFRSYCGGLPAPEADTNPLRYKYSWSPRGAVLAARNPAVWLEDGKRIEVSGDDLFGVTHTVRVEGLGVLEAYANRDATIYKGLYKLDQAHTLYRGTLRYPGHCRLWRVLKRARMLDLDRQLPAKGKTHAQIVAQIIGGRPETVAEDFAKKVGVPRMADPIAKLRWIGLFSDQLVEHDYITALDLLSNCLEARLSYAPGERDMVVLGHEFIARFGKRRQLITSQLQTYGGLGGDSAMSRTVSLPAAIATRLLCEGVIDLTGVHIPVDEQIYLPVLDELAKLGFVCQETRRAL